MENILDLETDNVEEMSLDELKVKFERAAFNAKALEDSNRTLRDLYESENNQIKEHVDHKNLMTGENIPEGTNVQIFFDNLKCPYSVPAYAQKNTIANNNSLYQCVNSVGFNTFEKEGGAEEVIPRYIANSTQPLQFQTNYLDVVIPGLLPEQVLMTLIDHLSKEKNRIETVIRTSKSSSKSPDTYVQFAPVTPNAYLKKEAQLIYYKNLSECIASLEESAKLMIEWRLSSAKLISIVK